MLAALLGAPGAAPEISRPTVRAWRDRLLALRPEAVRALAPDLLTGREDVSAAALLLLERAMGRLGAEAFIASPGGLRHGLALEAAG